MAKFYIANCTRQQQEVQYRLVFAPVHPGQRPPPATRQTIPPGRQICLGDFPTQKIDEILAQLRPFGLKAVSEIADDFREFKTTPYVFDVDRVVKQSLIERIMERNKNILVEEGRDRRRKAAIATNDLVTKAVGDQMAQAGLDPPEAAVQAVEFEQVERTEEQERAGDKPIEEGYKIDPQAPPPRDAKPAQKKPSRRRAASQPRA